MCAQESSVSYFMEAYASSNTQAQWFHQMILRKATAKRTLSMWQVLIMRLTSDIAREVLIGANSAYEGSAVGLPVRSLPQHTRRRSVGCELWVSISFKGGRHRGIAMSQVHGYSCIF